MNTFLSGPMRKIANMGRMGDTELAHVTPEEKRLLKAMGGSGTMNPRTGMPEYFNISLPKVRLPKVSLPALPKPKATIAPPKFEIKIPSVVDIKNQLGLGGSADDTIQSGLDTTTENIGDIAQEGGENIIEENIAGGGTISTSDQMKALLFNLANRGFLQDDYSKFTGTRFSDFDPMQLKAFGAINQFVDEKGNVITPSQFTDAASAAGAIAGTGGTTGFQSTYSPGTSTSGYNPTDYSVGFKTAGQDQEAFQRELDARMNPFTQGVINQLQKDISEQQQLALGRTGEQARAAGAFGGSRQGVAEALTSGRYGDAFARTAGQLRADQFNRAMSGADADRRAAEQFAQSGYGMSQQAQQARERFRQGAFGQSAQDRARAEQFRQGAFGQTEQAKQFADAARQRAAATRLAAASDLRTTGQAIDDTTASRINALSAAGKQRQALDQALKDFEYQQFLEERDFDKNQLLAAAGLLGSAPGDYYPPPPPQYYGRSGGLLGGIFDSLFGSTQLMG